MLQPGASIDKYEIIAPIAAGGMGIVYRARHQYLGKEFALKVLLPNLAMSPKVQARFQQEAHLQAHLQHANIVSVSDFIFQPGVLGMVMELVQGPSLEEVITTEQPGPWPLAHVLAVIRPVVDALAVAHSQGIVHRDLKPANVMLDRAGSAPWPGVPKITDFGIAKLLASDVNMTRPGARMGTPPYMSPEQSQGAAEADHRADVFAVGMMMWRMLAGRLPVDPDNFMQLMSMYTGQQRPPRLDTVVQGVPPGLVALVERSLAVDPGQRPRDAAAFGGELSGALGQSGPGTNRVPGVAGRPSDSVQDHAAQPSVGSGSQAGTAAADSVARAPASASPPPPPASRIESVQERQSVNYPALSPQGNWPLIAAVCGVLLAAGILLAIVAFSGNGVQQPPAESATMQAPVIEHDSGMAQASTPDGTRNETLAKIGELRDKGMLQVALDAARAYHDEHPDDRNAALMIEQLVRDAKVAARLDELERKTADDPDAVFKAVVEILKRLPKPSLFRARAVALKTTAAATAASSALSKAKRALKRNQCRKAQALARVALKMQTDSAAANRILRKARDCAIRSKHVRIADHRISEMRHKPIRKVRPPPSPSSAPARVGVPVEPEAKLSGKGYHKAGRKALLGGDKRLAVQFFKKAVSNGYGRAHGKLASIYFQLGDKGACAKHGRAYLNRYPDAGDAPSIEGLLEKCK